MGEVIQFVSKSERERLRLIREARAMYDSVFPPTDSGPGDGSPAAGGTNIRRGDGGRA